MKMSSLLNILSGIKIVKDNIEKEFLQKSQNMIEDRILNGAYVSREEFNNLQSLVIKLNAEYMKDKK